VYGMISTAPPAARTTFLYFNRLDPRFSTYFDHDFEQRLPNSVSSALVTADRPMRASKYPYRVKQRRRRFVRMAAPPDARRIIANTVLKGPTGESNDHRTAMSTAPITTDRKERIRTAPQADRRTPRITPLLMPDLATGERLRQLRWLSCIPDRPCQPVCHPAEPNAQERNTVRYAALQGGQRDRTRVLNP
jgi:hypothetical protein